MTEEPDKPRIAMNGPCRLTKAERRLGETKEFRNRRKKSKAAAKAARQARKR